MGYIRGSQTRSSLGKGVTGLMVMLDTADVVFTAIAEVLLGITLLTLFYDRFDRQKMVATDWRIVRRECFFLVNIHVSLPEDQITKHFDPVDLTWCLYLEGYDKKKRLHQRVRRIPWLEWEALKVQGNQSPVALLN